MTNQEAIKRIKEHIAIHKYRESHAMHIVEALEMAISALQVQEVKPLDTINRQDAIDAANRADYRGLLVEDVKKVTDEVVKELKQLPSAEPEIIYCKDCKHRGEAPNADGMYWCEIHDTFMYYCSDAERREDEQ